MLNIGQHQQIYVLTRDWLRKIGVFDRYVYRDRCITVDAKLAMSYVPNKTIAVMRIKTDRLPLFATYKKIRDNLPTLSGHLNCKLYAFILDEQCCIAISLCEEKKDPVFIPKRVVEGLQVYG